MHESELEDSQIQYPPGEEGFETSYGSHEGDFRRTVVDAPKEFLYGKIDRSGVSKGLRTCWVRCISSDTNLQWSSVPLAQYQIIQT